MGFPKKEILMDYIMIELPFLEMLTDYIIHQNFQKRQIFRLINGEFSKKGKSDRLHNPSKFPKKAIF